MKNELIALISQIEEIKEKFHKPSTPSNMPQLDMIYDVPAFSDWKQEIQLELQDIYDRTKDQFIWNTLIVTKQGFTGWSDVTSFNELRGDLLAIRKNIDKYYPNEAEKVNHLEKSFTDRKDSQDKTSSIFLSYAWQNENIANTIDEHFTRRGFVVKRDKRDIGAWESIHEFMRSIREQDYAVLIISDSYLKSENCMFEVLEVMKDNQYKSKIFPAVIEKQIYTPQGRLTYVKYWEDKCAQLAEAIKATDPANSAETALSLRNMKQIAGSINEFLSLVADMNNPEIHSVIDAIEKSIITGVVSVNDILWEANPPIINPMPCKNISQHPIDFDIFHIGDGSSQYLIGVDNLAMGIWGYMNTPKYKYKIYSDNYGTEYSELLRTTDIKAFLRLAPLVAEELITNTLFCDWISIIYGIKRCGQSLILEFGVKGNEGRIVSLDLLWKPDGTIHSPLL